MAMNRQLALIALSLLLLAGCMASHDSIRPEDSAEQSIDLSRVPDGTFVGTSRSGDRHIRVQVTVETGLITGVEIGREIEQSMAKRCALCEAEAMIEHIVDQQALSVDAISGATQTSNAVMDAIQDALSPPFVHLGGG